MNPQAWIALIGVGVALCTFLVGRWSERKTAQGAAAANATTLKQAVDKLDAEVDRLGKDLAALAGSVAAADRFDGPEAAKLDRMVQDVAEIKAKVKGLEGDINEARAGRQKLYERVEKLAESMAVVRTAMGMEDTGKHIIDGIEPIRGRAAAAGDHDPTLTGGRK